MNTLNKFHALTHMLFSILCITELKPILGDLHNNSHDLIVKLRYPAGEIQGHVLQSAKGQNYFGFQEIPYAKPPVGKLRYQIPHRHPGWEGVLNTTKNTKICTQTGTTIVPDGEDCLYLNVYSPVKPGSQEKLAVYVWIHGGGYAVWDGTFYRYSPEYLIDYNIIIVTMNYRLGALGFLATDDGIIPGNLGLRDQHLAIKWVHENIHLFGGDPDKVTIGGESAGSGSASLQILSSMSQGLFRGAILQSGSALNTFSYVSSPSIYAYKLGQLIDGSVDPKNTSTRQLLETLQKANISDLLDASMTISPIEKVGLVADDLIWAPTLENQYKVEPFISKPMHEAFINGDFNQVPLFIGFNSEEILWFLPTPDQFDEKRRYLDADYRRILHPDLNIAESNRMVAGTVLKTLYTNSSFTNDAYSYVKISSDFFLTHGIIRQADTSSKYVPVYLYEFDYMAKTYSQFPGTRHTEELQYLWKSFEDAGDINEIQPILRRRMCRIWTNFIKYLFSEIDGNEERGDNINNDNDDNNEERGDNNNEVSDYEEEMNPTPSPDQCLENLTWPTVQPDNTTRQNDPASAVVPAPKRPGVQPTRRQNIRATKRPRQKVPFSLI